MPRKKRDTLKRIAGHALWNVEQAQYRMLELQEAFQNGHPEYCQALDANMIILEQGLELFKDICRLAWGTVPEAVQRWRQVPNPPDETLDIPQ